MSFLVAILTKIAISIYIFSKLKSLFKLLKKYSEKIICRAARRQRGRFLGVLVNPAAAWRLGE